MGAGGGMGSQDSNPASNKFLQAWLSPGLLTSGLSMGTEDHETSSTSGSQNSHREGQMPRVVFGTMESRAGGRSFGESAVYFSLSCVLGEVHICYIHSRRHIRININKKKPYKNKLGKR